VKKSNISEVVQSVDTASLRIKEDEKQHASLAPNSTTESDGRENVGNNSSGVEESTPSIAAAAVEAPSKCDTDHAGSLIIEREHAERIIVGNDGRLRVPREDISADIELGEDLDLKELQAKKIRKPGRREWIALNRQSELPTRLLIHKPKIDGIEVEHYYIDSRLRGPVREELKEVRVFVFYSFVTHSYTLWIINVTIDNSWYESLQVLLNQPTAFFIDNAIRVIPDKPNSRYRVRFKPKPEDVAWPTKATEELLGEALGPDRFINSTEHPIYRDLIEGTDLRS